MILHCMKKVLWEKRKQQAVWGYEEIEKDGFIHCSTVEYFHRVAPNFQDVSEDLVLLCMDEAKLSAEIRFEDGDHCGRAYPHVYGLINNDAVTAVLPFLRDEAGKYIKNIKFSQIDDQ